MDLGIALRRFGLCGGPQDVPRLQRDPREGVLAEVAAIATARPQPLPEGLMTTAAASEIFVNRRAEGRRRRDEINAAVRAREAPGETGPMEAPPRGPPMFPSTADIHQSELQHLLSQAINSMRPLEERLALFWANHFTVSGARAQVTFMVGSFEREAIRPHMLGRFEDLLLATTLHPAMLRYLDNQASIGPNSPAGRGRRSVNENLAREVMELHTLGVDGGYTQADVTAFAGALSGWTAAVWQPDNGPGGTLFDAERHEPGPKTILGQSFPDGQDQAAAVLRALAAHPSTARFVTRKLAVHFLGEAVPPRIPAHLADVWTRSGGDLRAVTEALIRLPEAWTLPMVRLRSPLEFVMVAARIMGTSQPPRELLRDLSAMGQPIFRAGSPKGWPEEDNAWTSPDGIKTRLDWAMNVAAKSASTADPRRLAEQAFGASLSEPTRLAISRAESSQQGLAILLLSPEVQRR
ncbi:DUF1800 domain-containing protein [Roseococcus sp. YIM B11640]|uniref:DUF1800 domain-containing protein n=1 Tax=Roseococcus sp. YIM B11640 TaxID=3133973 RepID=UPI003C7A09C7